MIKAYALLPKRPDLSDEEFHQHWSTTHADHARNIPSLRRYVQAHRIDYDVPGLARSPYEGIPEVWYDSLEAAVAMADDPAYVNGAQADEPNFIDMTGITHVMTEEHVIDPGPELDAEDPEVKLLLLLKRRPGTEIEEFAEAWLTTAPQLLPEAEGLRRRVASVTIPATYDGPRRSDDSLEGEPAYDGFGELAWGGMEEFERDWEAGREDAVEALAAVASMDRSHGYLASQYRVIWP